jgi:hypothetical protein
MMCHIHTMLHRSTFRRAKQKLVFDLLMSVINGKKRFTNSYKYAYMSLWAPRTKDHNPIAK